MTRALPTCSTRRWCGQSFRCSQTSRDKVERWSSGSVPAGLRSRSPNAVCVAGIDSSEAMVARLRAKPGGEDIEVTFGDFAKTRVEGEFSLVYVVFNTIFNLVTQDEQVACFQNAAAHLRSGGRS